MWEAASDGQLHPTYLKVLSIFWVPITNLLLLFLEIFPCPRTYPTHVLLAPGSWLLAPGSFTFPPVPPGGSNTRSGRRCRDQSLLPSFVHRYERSQGRELRIWMLKSSSRLRC